MPPSTGKKVGPPAVAAKPFIVAGLKAVHPKVVAPPSSSSKPSTTSSAVAPSRKSNAFGGNNASGAKSHSKPQGVATTASRWWQEKATGGPVLLRMPEEGKWFDLYDTRWTEASLQGGGGQEAVPRLDQRSLSELTVAVEAAYRDEVAAFHKSKSGSGSGSGGGGGSGSSVIVFEAEAVYNLVRGRTKSQVERLWR